MQGRPAPVLQFPRRRLFWLHDRRSRLLMLSMLGFALLGLAALLVPSAVSQAPARVAPRALPPFTASGVAAEGSGWDFPLTSRAFVPAVRYVSPSLFSANLRAGTGMSFSAADLFLPEAPSAQRKLSTTQEVSVFATPELLTTEGLQRTFTVKDVESTPGTFGDLPRFVQTLAGVISDNDQRNDFLVRGGNPSENLFVIDNIEIPSINQLALSDTTGGLVSMLDNNAIQRFTFQDDAYASHYDQRLSSIIDISTRTYGHVEPHHELEFGIAGTGGSDAGNFGKNGAYFLSARTGILQYLTNDIGFNGTPHYRNAFARAEDTLGAHDSWWGMSLFGIDSIDVHPDSNDLGETNPYDVYYSGWRNATGVNWQHLFSSKAFGVASIAHTEQAQNIAENAQLLASALVYSEHSRDSATTFKYDATFTPHPRLVLEAGTRASIDQLSYNVDQPLGLQNPYLTDPTPTDAANFGASKPALTSAFYGDATFSLPHGIRVSGGERFTHWALDGDSALAARGSISATVHGHSLFFSYAQHAQLPPELYLLAFNNMQTLRPIRSRQLSAGLTVLNHGRSHLTLAAYNKNYMDYPVAANVPQVSLANISDSFGQAFLMFPMVPQGTGVTRGVEATLEQQLTARLRLTASAAYARTWFSGSDGVLRRGNYDIPFSGNVMAYWTLSHGFSLAGRFNGTSGRAYTPDNFAESFAQNRDVYDVNQINALRSQTYQRVDFHFEQDRKVGNKVVTWYVGMENALNRKNFYSQIWMPRLELTAGPGYTPQTWNGKLQSEQDQIGRFPDAGVKMTF